MGGGIDGIRLTRSYTISDITANQAHKIDEINLPNNERVSKDDTDIKKDVSSKLLKEESPLVKPEKAFAENHQVAKSEGKAKSSHKQFMANMVKANAAMKQIATKLQQQQKADILEEWTFVDKPIDKNGEAVDYDYETKVKLDNLEKQVNAEEAKAKKDHYEWQFVDVDKNSGKVGSISVDLKPIIENEQVEENKGKEDHYEWQFVGVDKNSGKVGSISVDLKPIIENEQVEENKGKVENKAEEGAKTEGKDKTEKKEGAEKAEGEKKTEAAEKKDGDIKVWFDKHPRFKLAMMIVEQILDAVIGAMSTFASKLPKGVGGCIMGGLSVIKGLAGFHKLNSMESDLGEVVKEMKEGGAQIANGISELIDPAASSTDSKKDAEATPGLAAKIIGSVGTMCGELSGAKSWEDVLNIVGKTATDIVAANNPKAAEITGAVKTNMGNFTKAISRGVTEIKNAIKNSDSTNDEKTMNALEMFKKTLLEDATLSEEEKNLVKALSDGAIKSIKAKGSKKTLEVYEETLGATASAILKGRNKEIAEQTLALMKEIRAEEDPFKAALHVIDKTKAIAGFESKEVDALKKAVEKAGKIVEESGKSTDSDAKVEQKAKDNIADIQKSIEGMDLSDLR